MRIGVELAEAGFRVYPVRAAVSAVAAGGDLLIGRAGVREGGPCLSFPRPASPPPPRVREHTQRDSHAAL